MASIEDGAAGVAPISLQAYRFCPVEQEARKETEDETTTCCCASIAMLGAGGAFAGEVKGPPGTLNNTNETGALDHANSACAASGLNDFDEARRTERVAGSDRGGLLEVLRASEGRPRHTRTLQGRNGRDRESIETSVVGPAFGRGQPSLIDTAALPSDRLS